MENPTTSAPADTDPLIPLAEFRKSDRCPVELHHLIFYNRESLEAEGAICRFGRKWLVSEGHLMRWLRRHGKHAGRPKSSKENTRNGRNAV